MFLVFSGFTPEKYLLPSSLVVIDESARILAAQVGVEEVGQNRGPNIFEYQKSVGIPPGSPYCAAGQYYCFWRAVQNLNIPTSYIPIKRTGLAYEIYLWAKQRGKKSTFKPLLHDLIVWRKRTGINGHIERIVEVKDKGWVETIGFNVRKGNKSGVFQKLRNIYHPLQQMVIIGLVGFEYGRR
ncbi:hypothetical protein D9V84_11165 [Bacteroidetes/Chlorobi group bacterium Naka2016]|jgi:hypothetical protein|nr:MAG: hypothetical protein D9V84_11165 [Bacteroidetes/Chlorobi group bacterium Naka2016]